MGIPSLSHPSIGMRWLWVYSFYPTYLLSHMGMGIFLPYHPISSLMWVWGYFHPISSLMWDWVWVFSHNRTPFLPSWFRCILIMLSYLLSCGYGYTFTLPPISCGYGFIPTPSTLPTSCLIRAWCLHSPQHPTMPSYLLSCGYRYTFSWEKPCHTSYVGMGLFPPREPSLPLVLSGHGVNIHPSTRPCHPTSCLVGMGILSVGKNPATHLMWVWVYSHPENPPYLLSYQGMVLTFTPAPDHAILPLVLWV